MVNRFNRLTSKEWLPFQKSWFKYESDTKLYSDNLRFFCKADPSEEKVLYFGRNLDLINTIGNDLEIEVTAADQYDGPLQFVLIDLRETIQEITDLSEYLVLRDRLIKLLEKVFNQLIHRRFVSILMPNVQLENQYLPLAWDMALQVSSIYSLKDEKIGCTNFSDAIQGGSDRKDVFYALYFRKDENSSGVYSENIHNLLAISQDRKIDLQRIAIGQVPAWFILKPAPRKKNEILHPAKYPEELVLMFIEKFTEKNDNVLDPMSGTGSTQVASLKSGRNAYGTELSSYFAEIATQRCSDLVAPIAPELFANTVANNFTILNKDARLISSSDFPEIDYMITSPPYWDMLNMKGAENQAKRIEKGLQTNYSESDDDLGNISDYNYFLNDLIEVFFNLLNCMKPGSFLTIVVKNIKKKGRNYPFAWDLASGLMQKVHILPEVFWCQDDINLAPYGYGNTFVSNTFHQYCLTFQKPN